MQKKSVILKPGKEKAIRNRHHWIFSGAIQSLPNFTNGEILPVYTAAGELVGNAYFNRQAKIIGRMVSFSETPPAQALQHHIDNAISMRKKIFDESVTNAFRLINGEGDLLPGLVVDKYGDYLIVQLSTLGMEKLIPWVIEKLVQEFSPQGIYEKSQIPSRKEEGLEEKTGVLYGVAPPAELEIKENSLRFLVSIAEGQKTGFFLDHREMRKAVQAISKNKRVLNCFSYSGGFSVYAGAGGATHVDSVDISKSAIELAQKNMQLNGFVGANTQFYADDVFQFLREKELNYDLVILDPPAFAKRQKDIVAACRGYKDINRIAIQKMPPGSILLTSSCSYHVDEELFQKVVFQASVEAKRTVKIIGRHQLAPDHPINICHPETDYLKSLLLYVDL